MKTKPMIIILKQLLVVINGVFLLTSGFAQLPKVSSGRLERIDNFQSNYCTARPIDIWLPDGYNAQKRYAVLYMHDGQMLYDSSLS